MSKNFLLHLPAIRERLSGSKGREYWRSLEEIADTSDFNEFLHREFPRQASVWDESFSRRRFIQLMGASLALAGLSACTKQPNEKIVPYVRQPEQLVPGEPLSFATAMTLGGYATGVLVTSNMGRPTKIEGNPDHPASLGSTDIFTQASILTLYDPDRSRVITHRNTISTWDKLVADLQIPLSVQQSLKGAGLRILTENTTSPTLTAQIQEMLKKFPAARWYQYEPFNEDVRREGARRAFGEPLHTTYRFDRADIVLSLGADFLVTGPGNVRYAHDFSERRRVRGDHFSMNRLYVAEQTPTLTGAMADHRLSLAPEELYAVAAAVAEKIGVPVSPSYGRTRNSSWADAVAKDLLSHRGSGIVVAGVHEPAEIHALVHAMNSALGNTDRTVLYSEPAEALPTCGDASLRELVQEMDSGNVDLLLILGGNPAYDAPADLDFVKKMDKVRMKIRAGLYEDETSALCDWQVPVSHSLESWSDARAFDGTATVMQPLIAPLYDTKSYHEIVDGIFGGGTDTGHDIVFKTWKSRSSSINFDRTWEEYLNNGVVPGTASVSKSVRLSAPVGGWPAPSTMGTASGSFVLFRMDPTIWDGRFANNGWLQELAKPLTKLTWDNAALIAPAMAARLSIETGDVLELKYRGRTLEAPAFIMPGQPDDVVTLHLGYGRWRTGSVGSGTGVDSNALRTSDAPAGGRGLAIRKTERTYKLVQTQEHFNMEGRNLVRTATLAEFASNPLVIREMDPDTGPEEPLFPPHKYDGYAWGMSIDLNACIGCGACTVACQSENNIPIVGKEQVDMSREMAWIRIDRYFKGDLDEPQIIFEPVTCMHCENAPCELVCPVGATVHDSEGLNVMVYNRCIGTRYCSNNCPYKVRRFNFLQYSDEKTETMKMMRNPEVTVRSRGVMEKCSYCIQRINAARYASEKENRQIRDGEVVTACQAACPANAIVFGDTHNKESHVAQLKSQPHDFGLLTDLNTKPRTTYLAKFRNPNPELEKVS